MEDWKEIPGYDGKYVANSKGQIKSYAIKHGFAGKHCDPNGIKSQFIGVGEYAFATLSKNSQTKRCRVHQVVAKAFVPNPNKYRYINHKNGKRSDNRAENLEWVPTKYHINKAVVE